MRTRVVTCLLVVGAILAGCGGPTATTRPSPSLITLDFTPPPTTPRRTVAPTVSTPEPTSIPPSWPVGWDVAFCTAFADLTVAHELLIDVERAIADDNKPDAQALANELAQTAPIAESEVVRMTEWDTAAELKTDLTTMLDLTTQASTAYQTYFNDEVRSGLRQARQLRNQVGKQVEPVNAELAQLTALGLSCPGTDLVLEAF